MKKIAVTGGKGGTGKSTVAVLLALDFIKKGKRVILADCDVECPNDYLLVGQKLGRPKKKVYAKFPHLNKKKCKKCGLCAKTCRENAIFQNPGDYPIFIKDLCSACGACWIVCPQGAIDARKEEVGKIYVNRKDKFYLVTGLAKSGLEETGPVVGKVKDFVLDLAKKERADVVLIDTAAGTHCPVITALLDCDLALAVTEPTPMGAYDLKLILDLCKKLGIKSKVILNQSDLGDKKRIYSVADRFGAIIDKEIPYSRKIVEHYSKGSLFDL